MESSVRSESLAASMKGDSSQPSKRLLFDRRYGWIVDEWKDPAEEALAGGRGMFCLLPMAKSLIKHSSSMVNYGLDSANRLLKKSAETNSSASNTYKSNWISEIGNKECTAEFRLPTSKTDIATQGY